MDSEKLKGSIVPLVTPFLSDGSIDETRLRSLIEFQISKGSHGISVAGTTGEPSSLSLDEREWLLETTVSTVDKRKPVVVGTGTNNLKETIRLTGSAEEKGADAALVIVPYYNKPSQRGLIDYFTQVAGTTRLPIIIYNIPGRTATNMEPETVRSIRDANSNIVGIKQSNRELDQVTRILLECGTDFLVYSGIESLCYPMLSIGGAGHFSATANILPGEVADIFNFVAQGRWEEARKLHLNLFRLNESIFWDTNPVPLKCAMGMMGMIDNVLRPPLVPLSESLSLDMRRLLSDYGLLAKGVS